MQLRLAKRELVEHAADLSVQLAGDRLQQQMTSDDQQRLVDRYLDQVSAASGLSPPCHFAPLPRATPAPFSTSRPRKRIRSASATELADAGHGDRREPRVEPSAPEPARAAGVQGERGPRARRTRRPGAAARQLLVLLAERGRLELLPALLEVYRERLLAHQNIVRASVTSAAPLSADTVNKLEHRLSEVTGKQVQLGAAVDPALIGGIVTRIGSTVYDGSVKTQLQKMKQQLIENA